MLRDFHVEEVREGRREEEREEGRGGERGGEREEGRGGSTQCRQTVKHSWHYSVCVCVCVCGCVCVVVCCVSIDNRCIDHRCVI